MLKTVKVNGIIFMSKIFLVKFDIYYILAVFDKIMRMDFKNQRLILFLKLILYFIGAYRTFQFAEGLT